MHCSQKQKNHLRGLEGEGERERERERERARDREGEGGTKLKTGSTSSSNTAKLNLAQTTNLAASHHIFQDSKSLHRTEALMQYSGIPPVP